MKLRRIATLLLAIFPVALCNATSIADVASQFDQRQVNVDSLLNYIKDPDNANEVYWWSLYNSEKDNPMANYILGRCFFGKIGTSQDYSRAKQLFEKASGQGIDEATVDLGRMYLFGWGVDKDAAKAKQLLKQAVDKNVPRGFDCLGWWYFEEEKDYTKALNLFQKAADAGYSGGMVDVGYMYENGYGVETDKSKALDMYLKAAECGSAIGLCNAGYFYEQGIGVDQDHEKALQYYLASAAKGNARGAYKVGFMKQYGDINEDIVYEDIAGWYEKSANMDYMLAKIELAFLIFDGLGVPQNQEQALLTFNEVGPQNIGAWGACRIADYYLKKDPVKSLEWAKAAHDNADDYVSMAESTKLLGLLYLKGGKEIYDYELAVKYLREGAEMDQQECIALMKSLGEPFEEPEPTISIRAKE